MDSRALITATKDEILEPQDWTFPVPIAYGPGRLAEIGQKAAELEINNALIVTDRGSKDLPFIAKTAKHLATAGVKSDVFAEISPNPRDRFQFCLPHFYTSSISKLGTQGFARIKI